MLVEGSVAVHPPNTSIINAEKRNNLFMTLFVRGCQFSGSFFSLTADFFPTGRLGDGFGQFSQGSGNVDVLRADGCAGAASDAG